MVPASNKILTMTGELGAVSVYVEWHRQDNVFPYRLINMSNISLHTS